MIDGDEATVEEDSSRVTVCGESLQFNGSLFDDDGCESVLDSLDDSPDVACLDLQASTLDPSAFARLMPTAARRLSSIQVACTNVEDSTAVSLVNAVRGGAGDRPEVLRVRDVLATPTLVEAAARIIRHTGTLRVVQFRRLGLDAGSVGVLAKAISEHPEVEVLDLSFNDMEVEAVRHLSAMLRIAVRPLQSLDLAGNHMGVEACKHLCRNLADPASAAATSLTALSLRDNSLGPWMSPIVSALSGHRQSALAHLDLGCNNLCDEGAKALAPGLARNHSLTRLDLDSCNIGASGFAALSKGLINCPSLQ